MARETYSEQLVKIANRKYEERGIAKLIKNNPIVRVFGNKLQWEASTGLDFSGVMQDGRHIELEVKETAKEALPMPNIRGTQIAQMDLLEKYNAFCFLLVLFSKYNEWYRVTYQQTITLLRNGYKSIPLRYFRAFGKLIRCSQGWPDYLSPEEHVLSGEYRQDYPSWMPAIREPKPPKKIESYDVKNEELRRQRVLDAMARGIKNARRKHVQVTTLLKNMRKARLEKENVAPGDNNEAGH